MNTPAQPDTPAEQLRAAAQELRSPTIPGLTPHLALMHQDFGAALADWLDRAAHAAEMIGVDFAALAVARALLGGAE